MHNETSWITIKPHLQPIESLLQDEEITNIECNADGTVFVEKRGVRTKVDGVFFPEDKKRIGLQNISRLYGQDISTKKPYLTARLPDGSRIAAMSSRCSVGGHIFTIRRFPKSRFSLDDLESFGAFPPHVGKILREAVASHLNLIFAGSTNSGKTTTINALCAEIDDSERILTIEDIPELRISKPNVVQMQALEATELVTVTMRDLLKEAMRHNPTRIILGELRSGEAYDFLQAMNTGHRGVITTIHSSSAKKTLNRLIDLVMQSGVPLPYEVIKTTIADAIDMVVFQERDEHTGKRRIAEVIRLHGIDEATRAFEIEVLYSHHNEIHQLTTHAA